MKWLHLRTLYVIFGVYILHITAQNQCKLSEFHCKSENKCIWDNQTCDGIPDCQDASDEPAERCKSKLDWTPPLTLNDSNNYSSTEFACVKDRICFAINQTGNHRNDCLDGSDGSMDCRNITVLQKPPRNCRRDQKLCQDGSQCVLNLKFCDGKYDCKDGSDEFPEFCDSKKLEKIIGTNSSTCKSTEVTCLNNSACIPMEKACNGVNDCEDASDEIPMLCKMLLSSQFLCKDGMLRIPHNNLCDGKWDCADRSDEDANTCNYTLIEEVICKTSISDGEDSMDSHNHKRVIFPNDSYQDSSRFVFFRGNIYCTRGLDCERESAPAGNHIILKHVDAGMRQAIGANSCELGPNCKQLGIMYKISKRLQPQVIIHQNCSLMDPKCHHFHHVITNGSCDSIQDCTVYRSTFTISMLNTTNQTFCTKHFTDSNGGRCLVCDGVKTTRNETEKLAENDTNILIPAHGSKPSNNCSFMEYACEDSHLCVSNLKICDGTADCPNGWDESNCTDYECPLDAFVCSYGACVNIDKVCDIRRDCLDNSDEQGCPGIQNPSHCPFNQVACKTEGCIDLYKVCDGVPDCEDASDEIFQTCRNNRCPEMFRCNYGACINQTKACDGITDCHDSSDEDPQLCGKRPRIKRENIGRKNDSRFACKSGMVINSSKVCDGQRDCNDGTDEITKLCRTRVECPLNEFYQCKYGACVRRHQTVRGIEAVCADNSSLLLTN